MILSDHTIREEIGAGRIEIDPFDEARVQMASIDLTLDDFVLSTEGEKVDISDGQSFVIKSMGADGAEGGDQKNADIDSRDL